MSPPKKINLHTQPHQTSEEADTRHFSYDLVKLTEPSVQGRYTASIQKEDPHHTHIHFESTDPEAFRFLPAKESASLVASVTKKIQAYLLDEEVSKAQGYVNESEVGKRKGEIARELLKKLRQLEGRERALLWGEKDAQQALCNEIIAMIGKANDENTRISNGFHRRQGLLGELLLDAKAIAEDHPFNHIHHDNIIEDDIEEEVTRQDQMNFYPPMENKIIENSILDQIFIHLLPDPQKAPASYSEAIRRVNVFFSVEAEYRSYSGWNHYEPLRELLLSLKLNQNKKWVEDALKEYRRREEEVKVEEVKVEIAPAKKGRKSKK